MLKIIGIVDVGSGGTQVVLSNGAQAVVSHGGHEITVGTPVTEPRIGPSGAVVDVIVPQSKVRYAVDPKANKISSVSGIAP